VIGFVGICFWVLDEKAATTRDRAIDF